MSRRLRALSAAFLLAAASVPGAAYAQALDTLRTRAERTGFRETSRYEDVRAFLEAVDRASADIRLVDFGYTFEGRALPLAVVGRLRDASPEAVRASGKTVVYLQADIHAGEVEGKEALQNLLRDVAAGRRGAWLDSLVLLVAPIFNADGNERVNLTNRPHQHGPVAGMGTRNNAQDLNVNRDFTKLDTPEARAQAALARDYDPHVLLDLHTTNGTFHAYQMTYAPPLHPASDSSLVAAVRGSWLPWVTTRIRSADGWDFHDYGNVPTRESPWAAAAGAERGWYSFDYRPRFSNNYWGLRNRFGILSETYSYLTFEERIHVQQRFVEEVLAYAAANATSIRRQTAAADARDVRGRELAVRARLKRTGPVEILMGGVTEERNPYSGEVMLRRTNERRPERMPEFTSFEAAETERVPAAWLLPAALTDVAERLRAHGVRVEPITAETRMTVEEFALDSAQTAPRESEKRRERTLFGRYRGVERAIPAGTLRIPADQPLARLAFILLEPRSDDGFAAWGLLDAALEGKTAYPILRVPSPPPARR